LVFQAGLLLLLINSNLSRFDFGHHAGNGATQQGDFCIAFGWAMRRKR